jgi:hypothetical protein
MVYYHSGVNQYDHLRILDEEGLRGMVSATTVAQPRMLEGLKTFDLELVLDSGAFQGFMDVDAYIQIVQRLEDRVTWYANLDVIGDQATSNRHQRIMEEAGLSPLWVYQVDGGFGLNHLRRHAERYQSVGIGGLVPHTRTSVARFIERMERLGAALEDAGAEAHFFGIGSPRVLKLFQAEPWFRSADSQKWLAGKRSHVLFTREGDSLQMQKVGLTFHGEECARQNLRQIERWASEPTSTLFTPHQSADVMPTPTSRPLNTNTHEAI